MKRWNVGAMGPHFTICMRFFDRLCVGCVWSRLRGKRGETGGEITNEPNQWMHEPLRTRLWLRKYVFACTRNSVQTACKNSKTAQVSCPMLHLRTRQYLHSPAFCHLLLPFGSCERCVAHVHSHSVSNGRQKLAARRKKKTNGKDARSYQHWNFEHVKVHVSMGHPKILTRTEFRRSERKLQVRFIPKNFF